MEKINVAGLLKDCPRGMELDCTMFENVTFVRVDMSKKQFPIEIAVGGIHSKYLTKEGCFHDITLLPESKCVIFPKGKTTWEGFIPPRKFKDGDVIFTHTNASKGLLENSWVSIFKEYRYNRCACYVCVCLSDLDLYHDKWEDELLCELCEIEENRLATEEEKEKLFQAIKDNGYKWNPETKNLEKLLSFKVGDRIKKKGDYISGIITQIDIENFYKVEYCEGGVSYINSKYQDNYELVPNKFDITNLKPFDKVLVRHDKYNEWRASMFSHIDEDLISYCNKYVTINYSYPYMIPYEGNEHLLGTTDDCDDFYKTW